MASGQVINVESGSPLKPPEKTSAEAFRQHVPGTIIAASCGTAWNELLVEVVSRRRVEECLLIPAVAEPLIVWVVSGCALVEERELGAGWTGKMVRPGDFFLTTTAAPYELRWQATGPADFVVLHAYLGLPLMARAGQAVDGMAKHVPRLREVSGERDPTLSMLLELVRVELTVHAGSSQLFVGGIAQSLAAHLVRTYAARDQARPAPRGGLPAFRLRRVTDLLAAHLAENLPLVRLAQEAGYSTFHFSRLFKRATGVPPSRYLIRLRTERARRLLRETTKSIIEIGLEVGYTNPSHFAQIFRQEVGSTPSEYRSLPRTPAAN